MSANYQLVVQKIVSISQTTKTFAFSLGTFQAIDPQVQSLAEAKTNVQQALQYYNIATVLSVEDSLMVFIRGARSSFDLVPGAVSGTQFVASPSSFNPNFVLYYPAYPANPQNIIVDARFYSNPVPEFRNHQVYLGGTASIVPKSSSYQTAVLDCGSNGFAQLPPTQDLRLGNSNYTHDIIFYGSAAAATNGRTDYSSFSALGTCPILDTRNAYGEGYSITALFAVSGGSLHGWWEYRGPQGVKLALLDTDAFQNWSRLSVVRSANKQDVYYNGAPITGLSNLTAYDNNNAYSIWLGSYTDALEDYSIGVNWPRPQYPTPNNTHLQIESYRLIRESIYTGPYNYNAVF